MLFQVFVAILKASLPFWVRWYVFLSFSLALVCWIKPAFLSWARAGYKVLSDGEQNSFESFLIS